MVGFLKITAVTAGLWMLCAVGISGSAVAQEKVADEKSAGDAASVNVTVPTTDEALQRLGVKTIKGVDVVRMATVLSLLGAGRTGGGPGRGLNYTCTSETNECACHGWLDCVLVMDECKTPPKDPGGGICTGNSCTCTWH
jgi:hypothetical protein